MSRAARRPPDPLAALLGRQIARGRMPGASWWVGREGAASSRGALGHCATTGGAARVGEATPFDLASLTKPLATAPLLVLLEQERLLDLDAPLAEVLDELRGAPLGKRSLLALASHAAGLPAWAPLYLRGEGVATLLAGIAALPPAVPPGTTLYSDLGYMALGVVLERASGCTLARLFAERIARPLALARTGFPGCGLQFPDAAETERGNHYERDMAGSTGLGHAWRETIPPGQVHDANAHALGGAAGHAGLFGTASEVARLAGGLFDGERLGLGARARERLLREAVPGAGRSVGMVVAAHAGAARGILPDAAPGHTGFTGTSMWLDPATRACFVLLTNRVHPRVARLDFQPLRRAFHRLAMRLTR